MVTFKNDMVTFHKISNFNLNKFWREGYNLKINNVLI